MAIKYPTEEEARAGFAALSPRAGSRYVAASDFSPPRYYAGGHPESVAEAYVQDVPAMKHGLLAALLVEKGQKLSFTVEVRHEHHAGWERAEVTALLRTEITARLSGED